MTEVRFRHDEDPPASDLEKRLRAMGWQLVGLRYQEAQQLMLSLIVSTIGNTVREDQAQTAHAIFLASLAEREQAVVQLARAVALKRREAAGHG